MNVPRSEYPRPQLVRDQWLCLNGTWEFEIDTGDSGLERGLLQRPLRDRILVPFCPESELSGIGNTDFLNVVWYRREVDIPASWQGQSVVLHFQAVDYDATVWVNGKEVGRHRGGMTGLTCDLTGVAEPGQRVTIVVRARDDHRQPKPSGKQSGKYANHGCHYTRTTGIWQTVWLEPLPTRGHLRRPRITPDVAHGRFHVQAPLHTRGPRKGTRVLAILSDDRGVVCEASVDASSSLTPTFDLDIPTTRRRLWQPEDPFLYDIKLSWLDEAGNIIDTVRTYAGLRSVTIEGKAVLINGRSIFQRLVLDQGYWPQSLMTAPSDEALKQDIELSMEAGFNGARLHQKVFEERFLYWADKLGYLCWGEFSDWGMHYIGPAATYITQWLEVLERDYNHPSIIGWCALNETWGGTINDAIDGYSELVLGTFLAAKAMDPNRPVLDASGWAHRIADSDVWDCHDYEQDPEKLTANHAGLAAGKPYVFPAGPIHSIPYQGQPFFVSEFGGIWWNPEALSSENNGESWGYGQRPRSVDEFLKRFTSQCAVLLENEHMFGYCYTQLTDVFQEQNGLFTFDRKRKFDSAALRAAQVKPAAIERSVDRPASAVAQ